MIQFFAPQNFVFFWALPALLGLFLLSSRIRRKRLSLLGHIPTIETKLMANYRSSEKTLKGICLILVFLFAILALVRPQWGEEKKKVERKGVDVIFMLDTSLSMLAEDVKPSRFEKAKLEIKDILARLKGDRVGMVAFAGSSFLQSPLTLDYSAFQLFLDAIKVGYIPDPGTSLDRALKLAIRSFPGKDTKHKAVILFTDGEDHEGGIEAALEEAKKTGLRLYTIGVGTPQGEPIPLRDEKGKKSGFEKDLSGQVVVTKLNQPLLEKIAQETGGIYLPSTPGEQEIDILLKHMQSLGKKNFKEKIVTEREDHYQIFLAVAFIFLLLEMFIRRNSGRNKTHSAAANPNLNAFLFGLIAMSFCGTLWAKDPVKLYEEKKYQSAMEEYRKKKVTDPDDPAVRYNLGTTLYQIDNFSDASKELEKTVAAAKDPNLKAKAYYNYGNSQYRLGNFEKAIDSYQKALGLNPTDKDAKYNLEFLQKKKSDFEKQNQDRQNQKQDQQQNQQNQQDQQQDQQQQNQQNQQQDQQNQQQDQQQKDQNQQQQNQQQNQNQQGQQNSEQQNQDQQQDQQQQQNQQNPQQDPQSQDQQDQQDKQEQQDQKQEQQDKQEQQEQQDKQEQQNQQQKDQREQQDKQEQQDQQNEQEQEGQQNQQQDQQEQKPDQGNQEQEPEGEPSEENPQDQQKPEAGQDEPAEMEPEGMGGDKPQAASETPEPQQQQGKQPLQGQMSLENALQILEALKEGEKEMHDLRKPGTGREQARVIKDW